MDTPLQIVADALVAHAETAFGALGRVSCQPAEAITREALHGADVLVVRSVTRVTPDLVAGTPVRFVGTATAGTDHLDLPGLRAHGITTAHAPGSNAASVVDHVLASLLALASDRGEALAGRTLGVVGAGAVGGRLAVRAQALGMRVAVCDPPRAAAGHADHDYRPLAEVLAASDVLSLHVPLTDDAPWPTRAMIGTGTLSALRPGAWLVNAARGGVVDGEALLAARPSLGALVLDCWPGEPAPSPALVEAADLASPHIAGHAVDARTAGTVAVAAALRAWAEAQGLAAVPPFEAPRVEPRRLGAPPGVPATPAEAAAWLDALARQACDVRAEDARFRRAMEAATDAASRARAFAALRRSYPPRREMAACLVDGAVPGALREAVTEGLGMRIAGADQAAAGPGGSGR